jgi:hypothetical protein
MADGTRTYEGRALPLKGEGVIQQETAATDILTIEGAASQTGDFLVCRTSALAEEFSVDKDGDVVIGDNLTITGTLTAAGDYEAVTANAYATNGAIAVTSYVASLTKSDGNLAMALAVPGAGNFQKYVTIYSTSAQAHVITVTGLVGGNTLTFGGAIGDSCVLKAISATEWVVAGLNNVAVSTA